jgi:hypothetical protein
MADITLSGGPEFLKAPPSVRYMTRYKQKRQAQRAGQVIPSNRQGNIVDCDQPDFATLPLSNPGIGQRRMI